jgi:hypothetical protein
MSSLVVTLIFMGLTIIAISILWAPIRDIITKSPIGEQCFLYSGASSIVEAKYLNNGEIQIGVKRETGERDFDTLRFTFSPSGNVWEISGKKCSDIRLKDNDYGRFYEVLSPGEKKDYVFDVSELPTQEKISLSVTKDNINCFVEDREID